MAAADERLRDEIGSERRELALALESLRGELERKKRRIPRLVAAAVATVVAVKVVRRVVRRHRR
jgi:hypothetical protein